jgi:molybdopterin-containing oxidoreductase family membrane subunit
MLDITKRRKMRVRLYGWIGVLAAIIVIGAYAWSMQLQYGLVLTHMRDIVSWGLYISLFAWFVGVSAGGLIVSSSAVAFGIKEWQPIAKLANLTAAVVIAVAALTILPDIGRVDRILNLFAYPNWISPLIWDVIIIFTYLVLSLAELGLLIRVDKAREKGVEALAKKNERTLRGLAFVALPVAVLTHSITAWIFGLQISRPLWNTALLAPIFLASALVSGLGLVMLVSIVANKFHVVQVSRDVFTGLARLLGVLILVDLFLLFSEYITTLWPGEPAEVSPIVTEFFGPYGWLAWLQWGLALFAFVIVAYPTWRRTIVAQLTASILVLVEVFFYRLELVIPAFVNPLIEYPPGTSLGTYTQGASSFALVGTYFPTAIEWSIGAGLVAATALLITLGVWFLFPTTTGEPKVEPVRI